MQLAFSKAGGERQQARHGVALAAGIDEAVTQHHITPALAVNQALEGA